MARKALQVALTWRRWRTGVRPSLEDTVLPYQDMNGALISKMRMGPGYTPEFEPNRAVAPVPRAPIATVFVAVEQRRARSR